MWSLCTLLAGVWVSCWVVPVVRGASCTEAQVQQCLKSLLIAEQPSAVIPWYSKAVVIDNCRRFQSFATCMKDITPGCTLSTQLLIQGVEDSYNYMCNEGFDEYVLHQPCFADPHVQDEAASCNATFNEKLNSLASINDTAYKRARICQYADNYIDCIGNVLKSFCGQSAASWQRTYDQKQLCPTLTAYGCPGWSEQCRTLAISGTTPAPKSTGLSWYMILVIVAIIVSALIIITSVAVLVGLRVSRRRPQTDDERPPSRRRSLIESLGGIDMPPPYPGPFIPAAAAAVNFGLVLDESCASAGGTSAASGGDADSAAGNDEKKRIPADVYAGEGHFVPDSTDMDAKLAEAIPPPSYGRHRRHHRKSVRLGSPATGSAATDPGGSESTPTTISDAGSSLTFARRTMTPDVIEAALGLAEGGACGGRGTAAAAGAPRADGAFGLAGYISESDMGSFGEDTFSSGFDGLPTVLRCVSHQSGYSADFIDEEADHRDVSYRPHDDYY